MCCSPGPQEAHRSGILTRHRSPSLSNAAGRWGTSISSCRYQWSSRCQRSKQEDLVEFVVPTGFHRAPLAARRRSRSRELRRSCGRQQCRSDQHAADPSQAIGTEPLLALWLPGDDPIAVNGGAAFEVPAGAELLVRVRYKKTWQYERKELRDRSTLGLYFAKDTSQPVRAIALTHDGPALQINGSRRQLSDAIPDSVRALAIYPSDHPTNVGIVVNAVAPDGSRRELIAFHPQREWARRYWFQEPILLERGTRLETTVTFDDETPALPLSQGPGTAQQDSSTVHLTLNVIPASR